MNMILLLFQQYIFNMIYFMNWIIIYMIISGIIIENDSFNDLSNLSIPADKSKFIENIEFNELIISINNKILEDINIIKNNNIISKILW